MFLMDHISRDWSLLPVDIINLICELLPLPDRIWFRAVCKSWYSAISNLNIPSPWLLLSVDGPDYGEYTDSFTFCSVPTNTTFKVPFPPGMDLSGWHCVGSQDGWLVMCDLYFNLWVVNPLTGQWVDLPLFSTSSKFKFEYTTGDDGSSVPSGFRDYRLSDEEGDVLRTFDRKDCYIQKIVFSSDPRCEDFCAMALFGNGHLANYHPDMKFWAGSPKLSRIRDVVFGGGKFLALTGDAQIVTSEFSDSCFWWSECEMQRNPMFDAHKYIVFNCNDDRKYMVLRNGDFQMHSDGKRKFCTESLTVMKNSLEVFEQELTEEKGTWEPVEDLDGDSILIGNNHGIFVSLKVYPQLRRNCVYVTSIPSKDEIFDMGVYDMEKKRFEPIYANDIESNWAQSASILFNPLLT